MTERDLVKATQKAIEAVGGWVFKTHGHLGQRRGIPDVLACVGGRFIGIECKGPRGRLTAEQAREIARIRAAGGIAGVARSMEDVMQLLQEATGKEVGLWS